MRHRYRWRPCSQKQWLPHERHVHFTRPWLQIDTPPHSRQRARRRLCGHIDTPPQSRHSQRRRPWAQKEAPVPHCLHRSFLRPCAQDELRPAFAGTPSLATGIDVCSLSTGIGAPLFSGEFVSECSFDLISSDCESARRFFTSILSTCTFRFEICIVFGFFDLDFDDHYSFAANQSFVGKLIVFADSRH
jgi:hypothetical protein